jgi:hypothetical protein
MDGINPLFAFALTGTLFAGLAVRIALEKRA